MQRIIKTSFCKKAKSAEDIIEISKILGVRADLFEQAVLLYKLYGNTRAAMSKTRTFDIPRDTYEGWRDKCAEIGVRPGRLASSVIYRYLKQEREPESHYRAVVRSLTHRNVIDVRLNEAAKEALWTRAERNRLSVAHLVNDVMWAYLEGDQMFDNLKIVANAMIDRNIDAFFLGSPPEKKLESSG